MSSFNYAAYDYIVGIDFGTTFSGASYAFTKDGIQKCCYITQWPKQKGYTDNQKLPTACLFDKTQQKFTRWGRDALEYYRADPKHQQSDKVTLVERFNDRLRLILESKSYQSSADDRFYRSAAIYFLHNIVHYTRKLIDGYVARNISNPIIHYVLALPSNWSPAACNEMKLLFAEFLDIGENQEHLEIISQSYAAALFCMSDETKGIEFSSGGNYLVGVLGGETSSFSVYESVTKDNGDDAQAQALEMVKIQENKEVESMIPFGSTSVDYQMEELFKKLLFDNDDEAIDKSHKLMRHLMNFFVNNVKPIFGEVVGEDVSIPMVNGGFIKPSTMDTLTESGIINAGHLHISYETVRRQVFDPVVEEIIACMTKTIASSEKKINATILVGGFSGSFYLTAQIEERLEKSQIGDLVIGSDGNKAVMGGAVKYGLDKVNTVAKHLSNL